MNHQEDTDQRSPRTALLRATAILFLCLCIASAILHANSTAQFSYSELGDGGGLYYVGWPVVYGDVYSTSLFPLRWPLFNQADSRCLFVDTFVAAALVVSPAVVVRLRRRSSTRSGQFTLSGLFLLTTAIAMVLALLTLERAYGWAQTGQRWPGVYSALRTHPWYDQVFIAIGIVCALYVALAAVSQAFRAAVVRLRHLRKKRSGQGQ
jgi:hypothetical protein